MSHDEETLSDSSLLDSVTSSRTSTATPMDCLMLVGRFVGETSDVLRTAIAVRVTYYAMEELTDDLIDDFLDFAALKNYELRVRLRAFLITDNTKIDQLADSATSDLPKSSKPVSPELEFYCYFLIVAIVCSLDGITRVLKLDRTKVETVGVLACSLYLYYSYSHEALDDLAEIRWNLLKWYEHASLCHNVLGQETLLNLLVQNYLHYNLYDEAERLMSKRKFEFRTNPQKCRYLFYLGKIQTIRLEYSEAQKSFLEAVQIAPIASVNFRTRCNKWAVLVDLLLGEIPERTIFMQKGMDRALRPYLEITNAVRIGDLEQFRNAAETYADTLRLDKTHNLIVRLRHSVIRIGLRNINISYSRISLADVAEKLKMRSANLVEDVKSIVANTIRVGVIDAKIDHAKGWLVSKEIADVHSTCEPQAVFNLRIGFCLNLHNKAVPSY